MSKKVLKTCSKCIVKTVVSPGVFWMTEYEKNNRLTEIELIKLEALLSHEIKNVKRKLGPEEISIGQVVAVTDNDSCYRGLITDIFEKNSKHTYEILLIDHGNVINTTASNICKIEDDELREKESVAFKVILHGISPVILDINTDNILSKTVFQKRISKTWSAAALNFVKCYLEARPFVYVKFLEINDNVYKGDVYVIEPGKQLVSLSKLLCDKDFAISHEENSTSVEEKTVCDVSEIEKKIPHTALSRRLKSLKLYNSYIRSVESSSQISLSSGNQSCNSKKPVSEYLHERGKSFSDISVYPESLRSDIQGCDVTQKKSFCGSPSSKQTALDTTSNLSPAWILKKVQGLSLASPSKSNVPNSSEGSDTTDEVTSKGQPTNFYKLIKRNEERKRKMEKSNYS